MYGLHCLIIYQQLSNIMLYLKFIAGYFPAKKDG